MRRVQAKPEVTADLDKYTYQRGPLVYCAEWPDNADKKVLNLVIPDNASVTATFDSTFYNGMYVLEASGKSSFACICYGSQNERRTGEVDPVFRLGTPWCRGNDGVDPKTARRSKTASGSNDRVDE